MRKYHTLRRLCVIISTLVLLSHLVGSCSQNDQDNAIPAGPAKPQPLSGQVVNVLVSWTQVGAAKKLAKWFNEETGAILKIIKIDYHDLLQTTMDDYHSATPQVDVMMIWYVHLGRLVEDGVLVNLDDFYTRNHKALQPDDFIPKIFSGYTLYKGGRWSVPFDGDTHLLFYRKSVFAKYNLSPPQTWDQYTTTAKLITEKESAKGIYGTAIMAHPTPILIVSTFMNRLAGFGGSLMDDDMTPRVNTPEAVAALTAMVEQSAYALPSPLETDFAVARDAFLLGQVAMVEQWTDIGIMAEDSRQSFIQGDWGAVPMPRGTGPKAQHASALNAGWTLGLSTKAPNREAAEAFLLFTTRPDICLRLNLIIGGGGIDPIRKSTIHSPEFRQFAPVISDVEASILEGDMIVWPNHPEIPELLKILSDNIVAAIEKRLSPQKALNACQESWADIVTRRK